MPDSNDGERPWILGYSASHNGAACLLHGDEVVAAIQEERLSGRKRDRLARLDESLALNYCLQAAGIDVDDLDLIVGCYFSGESMKGAQVQHQGAGGRFVSIPHHLGHAVGALVQSGFEDCTVLVVDGQGGLVDRLPAAERSNVLQSGTTFRHASAETISIYRGRGETLECLEKHAGAWMPDPSAVRANDPMPPFGSLGGMYSACAHQIFGDLNDAGKVMGLAALGRPSYPVEMFYRIDSHGVFHFSDAICREFQDTRRWPDNAEALQDLAASVQVALERAMLYLAERCRALHDSPRLCIAGGVGLNAIANERIIREQAFSETFIMPAAEDSGPAVGAAYYGLWHLGHRHGRRQVAHDAMGRRYGRETVARAVDETPCVEVVGEGDDLDRLVDELRAGKILGWFHGRSELGPRALGQRSILADPTHPDAKDRLNRRVKHREPFRPFAPLILAEAIGDWFEVPDKQPESSLMLRTWRFRKEAAEKVPAVVHHDGTGRLQTLTRAANPALHALLERFFQRTGVPILVNTSFNVMGEPIVETPEDALWSLLHTQLDLVVLEHLLVGRSAAFRSTLDLVPRLKAGRIDLQFGVDASGAYGQAPEKATILANTPWGQNAVHVDPMVPAVLRLVDGRRTAREVFARVNRELARFDERGFTEFLRHLRRTNVVSLHARS